MSSSTMEIRNAKNAQYISLKRSAEEQAQRDQDQLRVKFINQLLGQFEASYLESLPYWKLTELATEARIAAASAALETRTKNQKGIETMSAEPSQFTPSLVPPTQATSAPIAQTPNPTFKISAVVEGFPVEIEATGSASGLKSLIERLVTIGAQPPNAVKPVAVAAKGKPGSTSQESPICPIHNRQMKKSKFPGGGFMCTAKDDDGFCDEKA